MDYYLSDDFLKESLKAAYNHPDFDIETMDEHVPLVELFEYWTDDTPIVKIQLIDWSLHQRFFIHPDELDEFIHCSILDLVGLFKTRSRMVPDQFKFMYEIYGKIKIQLFEEFFENMLEDLDVIQEQKYLNQKN